MHLLPQGRRSHRLFLVLVLVVALLLVGSGAAHAQTLLRQGSRGPAVSEWQQQLNAVRDPDIAVDGIFGPMTDAATRDFQQSAGIAVDGVVGPQTREAMRQAIGGGPPPAPDPGGGLLRVGSRGAEVRALQEQLAGMAYWVGAVDGIYGTVTEQAVMAFQKVNGLTRDGVVGPNTRAALANPRAPEVRSGGGDVIEVNEAQQVLLYVRDGRVLHIFNTSTGTEDYYTYGGRRYLADTPNGQWEVYRQIDGWRESRLGRLYRPKYFHTDGIAIHGYPHVPAYPASHGCVRVSLAAMDFLWPRIGIGTDVWVY